MYNYSYLYSYKYGSSVISVFGRYVKSLFIYHNILYLYIIIN